MVSSLRFVVLEIFDRQMDSPEYHEYTKAVIALDGLYRACEIISDTVIILKSNYRQIQEAYFLEPNTSAIVIYRDYDERKSVYDGPWEAKKIEEWARLMEHPTVGFVDSQRLRNYFRKTGILVHLFIDPESINNDWNNFQDFIFHEVSLPVVENKIMKRKDFTIVFCDGKENTAWMKNSGLDPDVLPSALLIDFV